MQMKITDRELEVESMLDVRRGNIPQGHRECLSRHSDCFVLVCSGSADYTFGEAKSTASAGDLIYLALRSRYTIDINCDNYTFIYIDFMFGRSDGEEYSNRIFKSEKLSESTALFEQFYRRWHSATYADRLRCKGILYTVYSLAASSDVTRYVSRSRRDDMERITQYMSDNIADLSMSVDTLASLCGVSEVHLRRLFDHIYHTSPTKYLTSLRVRKAKELLGGSRLSMAEISEICGFRNQYYFSKVFKESTSLTPTEYRARYSELI